MILGTTNLLFKLWSQGSSRNYNRSINQPK